MIKENIFLTQYDQRDMLCYIHFSAVSVHEGLSPQQLTTLAEHGRNISRQHPTTCCLSTLTICRHNFQFRLTVAKMASGRRVE